MLQMFAVGLLMSHAITAGPQVDLLPLTDELRESISSILEAIDNVQERLTRIEMATEGLTASFEQIATSYDDESSTK